MLRTAKRLNDGNSCIIILITINCNAIQKARMTLKKKFKNILFIALSIYLFIQSTFFVGKIAFLIYCLAPPKINGIPESFSPYHLVSYFNIVLYCGVSLSGILFYLGAEPFVTLQMKNRRIIGIALTIIITPVYFILLFTIFSGIQHLL